jgi:hypothetical protein
MDPNPTPSLSITSNVLDEHWHPDKNPRAYEWWYFGAISDDGRDALIIVFLDNFIFSPRHADPALGSNGSGPLNLEPFAPAERYPAVSFTYFHDGKLVYRAMNEYSESEFSSSATLSGCTIGESAFQYREMQYGAGYTLMINLPLGGGNRLISELEWLSIETDFFPNRAISMRDSIGWNLSVPRSDVSGKVVVQAENGDTHDTIQFRGTGSHDHTIDDRWLPDIETRFHRGGAHFADHTAFFGRFEEPGETVTESQMILVRDGEMIELDAWCEEQETVRDRHGLKYTSRLTFTSAEGIILEVRPVFLLDSSFFYLRFWNEISLTLEDGTTRSSTGLSELIVPQFQRHKWLDWLANLRRLSKDF